MRVISLLVSLVIMAGGLPKPLGAAELQASTIKAWNDYVRSADVQMQARLDGRQPFLWTDESPDLRLRVQRGEVVVAPAVGQGTRSVPNGLIHDWRGAVFIPNTTIERLLHVLHDFAHYKEFYKPAVANSRLLACNDANQEFSMVWQRRILFVNAAMEGHYQSHQTAVDARHGYSVADSTELREIEEYGQAGEHLLPPDTGKGYIWRLHSIARYEQRDGGVYLELEGIVLTRDMPASLRWLLGPVVNHLSINSLKTTLSQTRDAVNSLPARAEGLALCPNRTRTSAKPNLAGED
jgi:hypothetical protein